MDIKAKLKELEDAFVQAQERIRKDTELCLKLQGAHIALKEVLDNESGSSERPADEQRTEAI